ncbi:MAG: ABC transporter ATP-binding protein [Candidatus Altiarchaeota archaeon]|nr:ABC transporter ATP-binding protein [Candidatus Altiarchaeota archaeon]
MEALIAQGLTKRFGLIKKFEAVSGLSMSIKQGEVHGFIGPNGAGKTTTIKMLVGALRPSKGSARILNEPIGSVKAKGFIGYSPEHPNFYSMNALDFLVYAGMLYGMTKEAASAKGTELMEMFGLTGFENRNARNFSAGMKQKLCVCQALIANPPVLILDEPTANLDPIGRYQVLKIIGEMAKKEKKTVLISSHILHELEKIVDHVTLIRQGKVLLQKDMSELRKEFSQGHYVIDTNNNQQVLSKIKGMSGVEKVWIGPRGMIEVLTKKNIDLGTAVAKQVLSSGIQLKKFTEFEMSLENIFLKLIGGKGE